MSASKRIVCDIDDTISFTLNRDWEGAIPNQRVIDKINNLYSQGWEIYLVTARGSLSCKSREEAELKYGNQIKTWLAEHGVKYNVLSFHKELAAYYIDDKGLTPEQFVNLEIETLTAGWSGASVELREGKVFKTHGDSLQAAAWYEIAKHFFNVPKIYSLIGQTICMEYIKPTSDAFKIDDIVSLCFNMATIPYKSDNANSFAHYFARIRTHINRTSETITLFNSWINAIGNFSYKEFDKQTSFCHGDLTLENIIIHDDKMYLIDPIYESDKVTYSSWLLDASKMLYSLLRHGKLTEYDYMLKQCCMRASIHPEILNLLAASHVIRVWKYAPESEHDNLKLIYNTLMDKTYQYE